LVIKEILARHEHISSLPVDAPFGLDTPLPLPPPIVWDPISNIFPIRGDAPRAEDGDGDGYDGPEEEEMGGWEDYALSIGAVLMGRIRAEVKRELGYTCSAVRILAHALARLFSELIHRYIQQGVAHNKTIAKVGRNTLVSEYEEILMTRYP
jgi:DNA polymerase eta